MIALLGPPPKKLIIDSEKNSQTPWPQAGHDQQGNNYYNARDYFGGPYFDTQGELYVIYLSKYPRLIIMNQANSSMKTSSLSAN